MKKILQILIVIIALCSEWAAFNYYHEYRQDAKVTYYMNEANIFINKSDSCKDASDSPEALRYLDSATKYNYFAIEAYQTKLEFK